MKTVKKSIIGAIIAFYIGGCSDDVNFASVDTVEIKVCDTISCDLDPLTKKPAVMTILLALGDEANNQLVINGGSSQLLAETAVRLSTPVRNPRILLIQDYNSAAEHPFDLEYVETVLLARFNVTTIVSDSDGITADELIGYDLVWFNNPGAPWRFAATRDALLAFKGGVIIEGDDLTRGNASFMLDELTGLTYVNNGTSVVCDINTYKTDNNVGDAQFRVKLNGITFKGPDVTPDLLQFTYGNDIDLSVASKPGLQVIGTAKGTPDDCKEERPTIVRYEK